MAAIAAEEDPPMNPAPVQSSEETVATTTVKEKGYWIRQKYDWFREFLRRPTTWPMLLLSLQALFLNADQNLVSLLQKVSGKPKYNALTTSYNVPTEDCAESYPDLTGI
jgi:hypothetical protein